MKNRHKQTKALIVFPVILEYRFTNRAFEIKANHGKRRKKEERGIIGCQWNESRFHPRADSSIRKPVWWGPAIVKCRTGYSHRCSRWMSWCDGITRRDRTLGDISSFPSGCAGPADLNENAPQRTIFQISIRFVITFSLILIDHIVARNYI